MERDKLVVPYPDDDVVRSEIEAIVSRSMPPRHTFVAYLVRMLREVGLRHLFRDWTELVYVSLTTIVIVALMLTAYLSSAAPQPSLTYVLLFSVSPVLYLTIAIIFFAGKRDQDTYELEMVCKYTVYQLAALRMTVFGAVAAAVNTAVVAVLVWTLPELDAVKLWLVSTASLTLFGAGFLGLMRYSPSRGMRLVYVGGWLAVNLALYVWHELFYTVVLERMPLFGYAIWIVAAGYGMVRALGALITIHHKEGYI